MTENPLVSILIPAYNAEHFIDRTLLFARGQTQRNIRILLSIDAGNDNTAAIAARHARADSRLVVREHRDRRGWTGNVNSLLEQVTTPFFCLYFHDDILLPQYTEHLLGALRQNPQAAGAYCAMGHFGASDHVSHGPDYSGDTTQRLLALMLLPERGSPLRALLRSSTTGNLRLPDIGSGGFWANEPFLMDMLLTGPLVYTPEVLYLRWNQRSGGLTDGWKRMTTAQLVEGWRANIDARLRIIERATVNAAERDALRFALFLHAFAPVASLYQEAGREDLPPLAELHPLFANPGTPQVLEGRGELIESRGRAGYTQYLGFCQHA